MAITQNGDSDSGMRIFVVLTEPFFFLVTVYSTRRHRRTHTAIRKMLARTDGWTE